MSKISRIFQQEEEEEAAGQETQTWTIFERAYDVIFFLILIPTLILSI